MHARSALFDLYGDHLRARGDRAPVAALVRLLAPLGIAAPAVRTAVSRMVRQGWLEPVRLPAGRGYALTGARRRRLDDAAARIYRTRDASWDGSLAPAGARAAAPAVGAERLRTGLSFLGYAAAADSTWISPSARPREVDAAARGRGRPGSRASGPGTTATRRAGARAWDLEGLAGPTARWRRRRERLLDDPTAGAGRDADAGRAEAFAVRSVWCTSGASSCSGPGSARRAAAARLARHEAAARSSTGEAAAAAAGAPRGSSTPASASPQTGTRRDRSEPDEPSPCCTTSTTASPPSP